jgi:DNA-binding NtrC family response regulator
MIAEERPPVEGILLVHNDNQLRDFCRDCFKQYGFRAVEAEDGFEAVLIAASRERPIGLLITDMENASINGIELPSMLQSISPQIKVVYLTGSSEKKRQLALGQISDLRKAYSVSASQPTKVVVTGR